MARSLYVMIATCKRPPLLRRTLESLCACRKPAIYRGTIVIENGPPGGVEEIVQAFSARLNAQYLYTAEPNKSNALNTAMKGISQPGTLVYFADDDVLLDPELLVTYEAASKGVDRGEFYGGPVSPEFDGPPPPHWLKPYLPASARGWMLAASQKRRFDKAKYLGFNWAAFAEDLAAIGGFDPRFGPGAKSGATGQETNAQRRLLKHGVRAWYLPEPLVLHHVPADACSPQWAVRRAHRVGISFGTSRTRGWRMTPWLLLALAALAFGVLRRRLPSRRPRPQRDFAKAYTISKWSGVLEGMGLPPRPSGLEDFLRRIAARISAAIPRQQLLADRFLPSDR